MRPFSDANTWNVHTWAQVAQAVTWDDYTLNSDGQVTVKATRGPVIVWGRRTGEGEDMPRLEAPTPSPLEVETARVNLKAHALAFARAAHGKVRHSVRWRSNRSQQWRQFAIIYNEWDIGECCKGSAEFSDLCDKRARSKRSFARSKVAFRKEKHSVVDGSGREIPLKFFLRQSMRFDTLGNLILDTLTDLVMLAESYKLDSDWSDSWSKGMSPRFDVALYAMEFGDRRALKAYFRIISTARITAADLVPFLVRAAYRAHVLRRVRSVSKRARVPRPLYARPRPPSCPLAPPVA